MEQEYPERVSDIVKENFKKTLQDGNVSQEEINKLLTLEYSKEVFHVSYTLLKDENHEDLDKRYYVDLVTINSFNYKLCSQWYKWHRKYLIKWIENHKTNDLSKQEVQKVIENLIHKK